MSRVPSSISAYNFSQEVFQEASYYKIGDLWKDVIANPDMGYEEARTPVRSIYAEPENANEWVRKFNPFTEFPGLYRTLADCPDSEEGILQFVRKYGFLTKPGAFNTAGPVAISGELANITMQPIIRLRGETLQSFRQQIREMRKAYIILRAFNTALNDNQGVNLSDIFHKRSDGSWAFAHTPGTNYYDVVRKVESYSIEQVAITQLQIITNRQLQEHVIPRLLVPYNPQESKSRFTRPQLYLEPLSLAGVCWVQVSQAISNTDDLARCIVCGTWFSRNVRNGKEKQYCSGACRTRAARQRAKS